MINIKRNGWSWWVVALCCLLLAVSLTACSDDGGTAPPGSSDSGCEDDTDCEADEVCDTESGECVGCVDATDCDGDELCDDGSCVECIGDDDCDGDHVCRLGSCAECNDDSDCEDDQVCSSGGECVDDDEDPCDGVDCPSGEFCDPDLGLCVESPADPGYTCHEPEDLGQLESDQSYSIEADPSEQPSTMDTSCSDSDVESGNAVFSFSVDEPMDVFFEFGDHEGNLVMEIREESCDDSDAAVNRFPVVDAGGCDNVYANDSVDFDAQPDTTYYVIIEARLDDVAPPFEIDITTEALACAPKGMWVCDPDDTDGQTILECDRGIEYIEETCGVACENDECPGDGCHNALEVTASFTVEGTTRPYTNSFDFRPHPDCSSDPLGNEGPLSDGRDMVFYLPDLQAGQLVVADGSQTAQTNYFGIMEDCDEENIQCIAGESHDQVMEWEVTNDGDYYLVINRDSSNAGEFTYLIDIVE